MPLDDDDNPALTGSFPPSSSPSTFPPPTATTSPGTGTTPLDAAALALTDDLTAEDLVEDEGAAAQDFAAFAASLQTTSITTAGAGGAAQQLRFRKAAGVSAQTIRKGEKDFEEHGTRAQADALERSRAAMHDVLSYTRVHGGQKGAVARGWVFADWWEGFREEVEEEEEEAPGGRMGIGVPGAKDRPARGKDWLLPEEALYLVERGSLDLWWPLKRLEEIFPLEGTATAKGEGEAADDADEYELGFPLSLQAAYALLIGNDGERGKISLQKFQVYSNLKRCGYNVLRAPPVRRQPAAPPSAPTTATLWQWFTSLLTRSPHHPPYGPLVQPGLYRSYASIYRQMALLPRHKPSATTTANPTTTTSPTRDPFTIHFHIWKAAQKWTKLRHPPPDFHLAVVDAQQTAVPALGEIGALLAATPPAPPSRPEWAGPGRLYARLKHGHRNVLVAVVDHGVINYMRFAEAAFGEEPLYPRPED
ncbi:62efad3c-75fb-4ab4-9ec7-751831a9126a [Thermothielavioides terrestris]|uniref:62efad3c-75fb-4ab4-9ec7-751831a9126a n=1 Tax=Thermothielavioides terrestris TaxID=2587410 RepID=A0A446BYF7_9PEZI|nr:62efad3c-75fb-4ab4-9ec7-751831a9126a [Thermothielavioides terrestris]